MEVLYDNLDYIQKTWMSKGRAGASGDQVNRWGDVTLFPLISVQQHNELLQSHAVNDECLKQANFIVQTKQVGLILNWVPVLCGSVGSNGGLVVSGGMFHGLFLCLEVLVQ